MIGGVGTYNRGLVGVVVIVLSALGIAATASATTGPTALNKPPRYKVTASQAKPFLGTYSLTHPHGKITNSTIKTAHNSHGYLQGTISVYQYYQGQPSSFVATLYDYRYVSGQIHAVLWSPGQNAEFLGRLKLRPVAGKLTGTLQLGGSTNAVTYSKTSARTGGSAGNQGAAAGSGAASAPASDSTSGLFSIAVLVGQLIG
jgi:hypothetical protein